MYEIDDPRPNPVLGGVVIPSSSFPLPAISSGIVYAYMNFKILGNKKQLYLFTINDGADATFRFNLIFIKKEQTAGKSYGIKIEDVDFDGDGSKVTPGSWYWDIVNTLSEDAKESLGDNYDIYMIIPRYTSFTLSASVGTIHVANIGN